MDDPYEGVPIKGVLEPSFDLSTEWGKKQNEFYTRYGIEVIGTIDTTLYVYDLTSIKKLADGKAVGHHITQAEPTELIDAANFLQNHLFSILGDEFVETYLPRRIMFLNMCGYYINDNLLPGIEPSLRMYPGYGELSVGCIALAGISKEFQQLKSDPRLARGWLSLIIEKVFNRLPYPKQFATLYDQGSKKDNYSYIQLGSLHDYGFICNYRESYYLEGIHLPESDVKKLSLEQDLGDYLAAVLLMSEPELDVLKKNSTLIASKIEAAKIYRNQIINSIKK